MAEPSFFTLFVKLFLIYCAALVCAYFLFNAYLNEYEIPWQTSPKVQFTDDEIAKLTDRIQNAGTEVVNAKAGTVSISVFK